MPACPSCLSSLAKFRWGNYNFKNIYSEQIPFYEVRCLETNQILWVKPTSPSTLDELIIDLPISLDNNHQQYIFKSDTRIDTISFKYDIEKESDSRCKNVINIVNQELEKCTFEKYEFNSMYRSGYVNRYDCPFEFIIYI